MPIDVQLGGDGRGERGRGRAALLAQERDELVGATLCVLERLRRRGDGIDAVRQRIQLGASRGRPLDELRRRLHAIAAPKIGKLLELGLHVLEPAGIRLESRRIRLDRRGDVAEAHVELAQLAGGRIELLGDARHAIERAERLGGQLRGATPVVRGERRSGRSRSLRELRHVAQALPVGPELLLALDRDLGSVLHERPQLGEPLGGRRRPAHELVVRAPRGLELPPGDSQPRAPLELLLAAVRIEDVELIRRARQPTLLELARHRHEPLRGGSHVFARGRASPGVRARATVTEHPPGDDDVFLALRP